jgi:serine/threonine protein kinase
MIGEIVDGHEILRLIGTGGMGEVYLARGRDDQLCALKVVRADHTSSPQAAARFRREVLALRRLQHPGIVHTIDAGQLAGGALYLAMEYAAGPDLKRAIGWSGPFAMGDALRILAQLAAALAYAHEVGIVHRDLKPSNVILVEGRPEQVKIIDFGLAKIVADEGLTRLTDDQELLGSPLYWAPEQSRHASVGSPADVYALGGIAYYVLSGRPMFRPRPDVALVYAHLHETPEPLATRCRGLALPPGLEALVATCVMKAPEARPSAAALVSELDRLIAHVPADAGERRAERLFTVSGMGDLGQALLHQIRQVVLELAAVLERPSDDVDRLQQQVSELELELAVLEADAVVDPAVGPQRTAVAASVEQLQGALADAYRLLYDDVTARRAALPADGRPLIDELDGLVKQFRAL